MYLRLIKYPKVLKQNSLLTLQEHPNSQRGKVGDFNKFYKS